ncbi:CPBP family intramembrane metalloprotease [Gracilibacillus oryzae]|uniref:CPBP family intramembrane metalloprotease n=1 Tax=Gracilibacillus oryzae TaxID=1672701 RepID=A0A7C8KQF1_9BACI|nr:CPBP family intramembrane glutamic endopeptidase [Gracilibacillus oryzae]KAB8136760.1 CPBP family intramembrane metalloprotease [Gracilibacillus oryzae]
MAVSLHSTIFKNIASLFIFSSLVVILQWNDDQLLLLWGTGISLLSFVKSMRLFSITTVAFGAGFYLYSHVNDLLATMMDGGTFIIWSRLSLTFILLSLIIVSLIYKRVIFSSFQKPQWKESVHLPFILTGRHNTTVRQFLLVAMMINLIVCMPFIWNSGWEYIKEVWLFLLGFSVMNTVLEETIWRGILLDRFSECFGNSWAVLITSVGFGLQHYSLGFPWSGCVVFILGGLYFGAITVKANSIIPAIIWHMFLNILMVWSGMIV